MFSIVITEKGGAQQQLDFDEPEISIGRLNDNTLCLPKNNVSKHHARLLYKDDRYVIVDRQSTNGTYVNGRRITGPAVVRQGDKIYIGDFILTLAEPAGRRTRPGPATASPQPAPGSKHPSVTEASGLPEGLRKAETQRRHPTPSASGANPATGQRHAAGPQGSEVRRARSGPPPLPRTPSGRPSPDEPDESDRLDGASELTLGGGPARHEAHAHIGTGMPLGAAGPTQPAPSPRMESSSGRGSSPSIPPLPPLDQQSSAEGVDSAQAAALSGLTSPAVLAPNVRLQTALSLLMERLAPHLDIQRQEESAFPSEHQGLLDALIEQLADEGALAQDIDRRLLREAAINEAVGLGPLERLLGNRQVKEIVVDGPTCVHADLGGGLTRTSGFFTDDSAVLVIAGRLLHRAGQKLDPKRPVHEAQLQGGGTLQLLLPPLSPRGPLLSVRCATRAQRSPESYVAEGVLSSDMLALLRGALQQRRNVLVLGPTGAGVSELLLLLSRLAPEHERIVTIEESPNASLLNPQAMPLCRRAMPQASLQDLLQRAALLRPDRTLIDDLRLDEASTALTAAAGGGGLLLGLHAPEPAIALSLLTYSAGQALGGNSPLASALVAAALQLLVHVGPDASGTRKVQSILELQVNAAGTCELRPVFRHEAGAFVASFLGR